MTHVARREPRPPRTYADFNTIPPSQYKIHDRLENWAKWCRSRGGDTAAPMFRLHKSDTWDKREYGAATELPVDKMDAQAVAKGVAMLPDKHRRAISWCYLSGKAAGEKARELGLSMEGLADLIGRGRQMLLNRGV